MINLNGKMNFFLDPKNRVAQKPSIMNYKQDEKGLYLLADKKFINWMDVHTFCHTCMDPLTFDNEFDASYCASCNEWREERCSDISCEYCENRPERPLDPRK
ncbi:MULTISPECIES: hypothetical protein [unclassified Planococcus (in: firmicutes)]|uniref:hypothetical protein n=1 Tax=unclassified Planococcus (in: firmicutes) TaxID=2662419 RepID=UPI002152E955|nr:MULTISPECIES: hypothetical protein [unclassified Planococcus (in: firmicutes)]MDE4086240.1 hypothetical protein [Planococcus maritimus]